MKMEEKHSARHTSGPWAVNPVCAQVDAMPSGLPICQLLWPTDERSEAETEANAHLIAAAPDLLEALIVCTEDLESEIRARAPGELPRRIERDMETVRHAQAVIAKALNARTGDLFGGTEQ